MLTLVEAGERLGLSPSTLRHQVKAGRLKGRLVGKTWTVSERELERYRSESLGRPGRRSGAQEAHVAPCDCGHAVSAHQTGEGPWTGFCGAYPECDCEQPTHQGVTVR